MNARTVEDPIILEGRVYSAKAVEEFFRSLQVGVPTSSISAQPTQPVHKSEGSASDTSTSVSLQTPSSAPTADPRSHAEPHIRGDGDAGETATTARSLVSATSSGSGGTRDQDPLGPVPGGEAAHLSEITIDEEFSSLIPPLSKEEFALLEDHLRTEGCRDPILVWDDGQRRIVLDGHSRLQICRRHHLHYDLQSINLPDRDTARMWILEHQLGRRNLTPEAQAYLLGKLYSCSKSQGARTDRIPGHSDQRMTAAEQLADKHRLGEKTIRRYAKFVEQVDRLADAVGPDIRQAVLVRDAKISRTDIGRLLALEPPTRDRIIAQVREGKAAARLIKEAMRIGDTSEQSAPPARTTTSTPSEAEGGRPDSRADATMNPTEPQSRPEEAHPASAFSLADRLDDITRSIEQRPASTILWTLAIARQALAQGPREEIRRSLASILEGVKQVQMALQAHEDAAHE